MIGARHLCLVEEITLPKPTAEQWVELVVRLSLLLPYMESWWNWATAWLQGDHSVPSALKCQWAIFPSLLKCQLAFFPSLSRVDIFPVGVLTMAQALQMGEDVRPMLPLTWRALVHNFPEYNGEGVLRVAHDLLESILERV